MDPKPIIKWNKFEVFIIKDERKETLFRYRLNHPIADVHMDKDKVIVREVGGLEYCISLKTKQVIHMNKIAKIAEKYNVEESIVAVFEDKDKIVLVTELHILVLDKKTLEKVWEEGLHEDIITNATYKNGLLTIKEFNGNQYVINTKKI